MRPALAKLRVGAGRLLTEFLRLEAASGILLIGAALLALACANTSLHAAYEGLRATPVQLHVGAFGIDKPLLLWINDGLMALFFLLVALEIKREVLSGQLSSRDQLALPLVCAAAGVATPALAFWLLNRGDEVAMRGWAIPTATDIAFAIAVFAVVAKGLPPALRVFLLTLAVVDDLFAITIIATVYTDDLQPVWLAAAIVPLGETFTRSASDSNQPANSSE